MAELHFRNSAEVPESPVLEYSVVSPAGAPRRAARSDEALYLGIEIDRRLPRRAQKLLWLPLLSRAVGAELITSSSGMPARRQGQRGRAARRLRRIGAGVAGGDSSSQAVAVGEAMARPELRPARTPLSGGRIPQRVPIGDTAAVQAALARDGAVILTDLPGAADAAIGSPRWEQIAGELPELTFATAGLIPGLPPVACMHHEFARNSQVRKLQELHGEEGGVLNKASADELLEAARQQGWTPYTEVKWQHGVRQNPHTDGYVYGDHVPDHIFLLMELQNDFGGDSFFVDGEAVLERLSADPDADALLPLLSTLVFDQQESEANGGIFQGRPSSGPLFSRRACGRLQWKRMLGNDQHQDLSAYAEGEAPIPRSCYGITPETLAMAAALGAEITPEELLRKLDLAIQAESEAAGRVQVNRTACRSDLALLVGLRVSHRALCCSSTAVRPS